LKNLVTGEDQALDDAYKKLRELIAQEGRLITSQTLVNSTIALRKLEQLETMMIGIYAEFKILTEILTSL
jgi:hypothetical protein